MNVCSDLEHFYKSKENNFPGLYIQPAVNDALCTPNN